MKTGYTVKIGGQTRVVLALVRTQCKGLIQRYVNKHKHKVVIMSKWLHGQAHLVPKLTCGHFLVYDVLKRVKLGVVGLVKPVVTSGRGRGLPRCHLHDRHLPVSNR